MLVSLFYQEKGKRLDAQKLEIAQEIFTPLLLTIIGVIYFEAMDVVIQCINDRFDQPGYKMYSGLETLLLKGCKQLDYQHKLDLVKSLYDKDLNYQNLEIQFQTIASSVKDDLSLSGIVSYLKTLSSAARSIYSEIVTLVEVILVMPATNATSEQTFRHFAG